MTRRARGPDAMSSTPSDRGGIDGPADLAVEHSLVHGDAVDGHRRAVPVDVPVGREEAQGAPGWQAVASRPVRPCRGRTSSKTRTAPGARHPPLPSGRTRRSPGRPLAKPRACPLRRHRRPGVPSPAPTPAGYRHWRTKVPRPPAGPSDGPLTASVDQRQGRDRPGASPLTAWLVPVHVPGALSRSPEGRRRARRRR